MLLRFILRVLMVAVTAAKTKKCSQIVKKFSRLKDWNIKQALKIKQLEDQLNKKTSRLPPSVPTFPQTILKKLLTPQMFSHYKNVIAPFKYSSTDCVSCPMSKPFSYMGLGLYYGQLHPVSLLPEGRGVFIDKQAHSLYEGYWKGGA